MKVNENKEELMFLQSLSSQAVNSVIKEFFKYAKNEYRLSKESLQFIDKETRFLEKKFVNGLVLTNDLANLSLAGKNKDKRRISYFNKTMAGYKQRVLEYYPPAANAWVLHGLVFNSQIAGLKKMSGFSSDNGYIIDVLNSASSLDLGAENPWLIKMDRIEDHLGIKDNICTAYHPGVRQGFALKELAKLHPNKKTAGSFVVHSETSGTVVDSIAIESVVGYGEKKLKNKNCRVLAVDGTWAGGYGSAREGTGFGIDGQQKQRSGKNIWVDRCLPQPIKELSDKFLAILEEKLKFKQVAGLYIEPDIVGDLGIVEFDRDLLKKVASLMKENRLPIIVDCVQQLGRSGGYWGENVESVLKDYPLLVLTTAKSASNGQPLGFTIMPKEVADSAHPLSQITTNQMNGPLLRALTVAKILSDKKFQNWLKQKSKTIEKVASEYGFKPGNLGLRGKFLNRGIYMGDNEKVKLAQIALLIEDGILVGAVPQALRYQPMLFDLSDTNEKVARAIFNRVKKILNNEISKEVKNTYKMMKQVATGLARKNI